MSNNFEHLKVLGKKIAIALIAFTLCRLVFFLFYIPEFSNVNISLFCYGIRFDIVAISFLLAPSVLLDLAPFSFRNFDWYKKLSKTTYFIGLFLGIALNMLDVGYFEYTLKRTTADLFGFISEGDDFWTLLPHYIIDFWYAYLLLGLFIFLVVKAHNKWCKNKILFYTYTKKDYIIHSFIFILSISFLLLGMRGGFQYKPLGVINAGQYASVQNIPIVLNTPFTIMKTLSSDKIEVKNYYPEEKLPYIYSPEQYIQGNGQFADKNIVIIILESFAKEYVGFLNNNYGYTPFLDSLMENSYVYTNAYANGQRSMESLPSILAGLPQLMNSSYIVSNYAGNNLDGLPKLLKRQGYNTSFYHGGANGTMGFNGFTKIIGIDNYYGLNEYPKNLKEKHYDGLWGVFDEPYLKYYADQLNTKKEPFFSVVFTLSSHHPYTIPEKHKGKFDKGKLDIHESIGYTDFSLKQFLKKASKMKWFNNTVFVITADHSSLSETAYYKTKLNRLAIPIMIYAPNTNFIGVDSSLFQQTDITATVLSHTTFSDSIITFGNNPKNTDNKYIINFISGNYQISYNNYFLIFDGEKSTNFYNTKTDSLLTKNIINKLNKNELIIKNKMEKRVKATIQQYNTRVINNNLSKS